MSGRPVKHSVTLKGHRTSISLEDEFWHALRALAERKALPINVLIAEIDVDRGSAMGLASAIRVHILRDLQQRLAEAQIDAR
ncbi:ribbon-helix-helix domain-containing protein [uncultured Roseobacter sp.]|uniref:ribbon-helix-helix domain-containing protein n=1 Tax=uncultured Roseobacter sp. TaxID=114847 RepID=UPI00260D6D56|nr:ribbon-helix-helix domain-containing protein [uncultured Roseobacter sp.]